MNAKVNVKVEVIDGEDVGYSFSDNRVVPLFDPPMDGYVHPYTLEYKFMTPGLHRQMMEYGLKNGDDIIGFPTLALTERKPDALFLLKQIKDASEAVQNVNGTASTLLNGIECNSEFLKNIETAIKLLEQLP